MRLDSLDLNDSYVYETLGGRYAAGRFPVAFRSLPSIQPAVAGSYVDRELFWVPLVRAGLEASEIIPDWNVYAFILQPPSQLRESGVYTLNTAAANYGYGDFDADPIVCANPDAAAYFPKVFRIPAFNPVTGNLNLVETSIDLFGYVKPGDKVLGDNGKIFRVAQVQNDGAAPFRMILASETLYEPLNERDLRAIWVAPAPGGANQDSPLADIRLLSNTVVRSNDY